MAPLYEYIASAVVDGELPRDFSLPELERDGQTLNWADGALDGVTMYHIAGTETSDEERTLISDAVRAAGKRDYDLADRLLAMLGEKTRAISVIPDVQSYVIDNHSKLNEKDLFDYGLHLLFESEERENVKFGLSLLELFKTDSRGDFKKAVRTIGLSDEFTLFAIFVMMHWKNGNDEVWQLAKKVHGWGRVHAVEFLEPETEEIRYWLLTEGVHNDVMPAYSALTCWNKSDAEAVLRRGPSREEFTGIRDIIDGLLDEGPVPGISAIDDRDEIISIFLDAAATMELDLEDCEVIFDILSYYREEYSDKCPIALACRTILHTYHCYCLILDEVKQGRCIDMAAGIGIDVSRYVKDENDPEGDGTRYYDMEFHRGGRDARPENTLYSYQYAIEKGALTIECDMQMTADGHIVMSHNPALNPIFTTDAEGRRVEDNKYYICDMTLQEVQSFNVGRMDPSVEYYELHGRTQVQADTCIPSLRQMFELVRDSGNDLIRMSIEAKVYPDPALGTKYEKNYDYDKFNAEFLALVNEFGFRDRVILQCFDWALLVKMKELDPGIRTIALYSEQPAWGTPDATTLWLDREEPSPWLGGIDIKDFDGDPVRAAHSLGIDDVSPYFKEITKELTDEAHELGMKVVPWTVNSIRDMSILYRMGVDGIITDKPWILREYLEKKGEKLPPITEVDLPYHLEPDHYEAEERKSESGRDAAY